ncbi:MAG: aldose 1-epimerase family protein [Bacteroidetes bacterium]|nr:aldose 1-epimerase family protein [Bacteroidota bacterium]MDA1120535.1 aldose 1-epimerase family protein [Bacteroidota bacterium]
MKNKTLPLHLMTYGVILISCNQQNITQSNTMIPSHTNILISAENNVSISEWSLSRDDFDLGSESRWSVNLTELKGGKQDGVKIIEVNNGKMNISVIPTRGMSILSVRYEDVFLGWDSPVKEIIHPKYIDLEANNGLGWLEGFNEWMVRCGMAFAGHPGLDEGRLLTLHGKIGNIPASEVEVIIDEDPPHTIRIRGKLNEVSFNGTNLELWSEVSTIPGSNSFRIDDVLTNKSLKDQEFMVIYHANFGAPLLEQGSQLYGTIEKVVPFDDFASADVNNWSSYGEPSLGIPERVNCIFPLADEGGNTHFLFQNSNGDRAVSFMYPREQLPYFSQWKNMDTNGYVTGLEPGTGFPHNRSVERKYGRVPTLKSGTSRKFTLEYTIHTDKDGIRAAVEKIQQIGNNKIEIATTVIAK